MGHTADGHSIGEQDERQYFVPFVIRPNVQGEGSVQIKVKSFDRSIRLRVVDGNVGFVNPEKFADFSNGFPHEALCVVAVNDTREAVFVENSVQKNIRNSQRVLCYHGNGKRKPSEAVNSCKKVFESFFCLRQRSSKPVNADSMPWFQSKDEAGKSNVCFCLSSFSLAGGTVELFDVFLHFWPVESGNDNFL